ncbi:GIY-YIG nuclease family protein [Dyella sp. 20L07]|uniref:GIY-YIG nuclease family protein n=1 Tax=Dyella sp. 20L07 TaxID=3384240 RepID=UPI003D26F0E0
MPAASTAMDEDIAAPRFASRGRAYVYVLPCRDEDLLKVGFSRDPMQRFRTLHRRFFEFFDLDRGLLIEVDRVAQARRIERLFLTRWADQRAQAPLVVPTSAAGHTEWYRGIDVSVTVLAHQIAEAEALVLHEPLRKWLAGQLADRTDALYDWSERVLSEVLLEQEHAGLSGLRPFERALLDTLDMCDSAGLSLDNLVPPGVQEWYRYGPHRSLYGR